MTPSAFTSRRCFENASEAFMLTRMLKCPLFPLQTVCARHCPDVLSSSDPHVALQNVLFHLNSPERHITVSSSVFCFMNWIVDQNICTLVHWHAFTMWLTYSSFECTDEPFKTNKWTVTPKLPWLGAHLFIVSEEWIMMQRKNLLLTFVFSLSHQK